MIFPFCGIVNGFGAGRLYAFFHGTNFSLLWPLNAILYPLIIGVGFFIVDICEYIETGKIHTILFSESYIITLVLILINVPFNFIGCFFGYKMQAINIPNKISRVPREPPNGLPWFLNFNFMSFISGIIPVLVIAFEMYQIWSCIKGSSYIYLVYWSFYISCIIFLIVVSQLSIMQTYLLICYEEYRWWWRCWALGASTGVFSLILFIN